MRTGIKLSKLYLEQMIADGLSRTEIAAELKTSETTVINYCDYYGIPRPRKKKSNPGKWDSVPDGIEELSDVGVNKLVAAIIGTAVTDYRNCTPDRNQVFRNFFRSQWYEHLMCCVDNPVSGEYIITKVEREKIYGRKNG